MSRAGILLRVLLGVSLVLNGIGGSLAATTMAMAALGPDRSVENTAVSQASHSSCHDHAATAHAHQSVPTDKLPAGHADCCGVGLCGCACAQLSSLAAADWLLALPMQQHEQFVGATAMSLPAPTLPHLIRPPIA